MACPNPSEVSIKISTVSELYVSDNESIRRYNTSVRNTDDESISSTELATTNLNSSCSTPFAIRTNIQYNVRSKKITDISKNDQQSASKNPQIIHIQLSENSTNTTMSLRQPESILNLNVPSFRSIRYNIENEPPPLSLQAVTALNRIPVEQTIKAICQQRQLFAECSRNLDLNDLTATTGFTEAVREPCKQRSNTSRATLYNTPDSSCNAPPSYAFVLRQMQSSSRRPRLLGTFIPSPSYILQQPPPNYSTAFDIYVDSTITRPVTRVFDFGFTSVPVTCPECGYAGMTMIITKVTLLTHLCACCLCIFCCWLCVPLPYMLSSCKDVYHYCRGCRSLLGMYSPNNPDSGYPPM